MTVRTVCVSVRQFFRSCRSNVDDRAFKMQRLTSHWMVQINNDRIFCYRNNLSLEMITLVILQRQYSANLRQVCTLEHFDRQVSYCFFVMLAVSFLCSKAEIISIVS